MTSIRFDYKKLTEDLVEAKALALGVVTGDNGGSANLDKLALSLPRLREDNVIKAIKDAGFYL